MEWLSVSARLAAGAVLVLVLVLVLYFGTWPKRGDGGLYVFLPRGSEAADCRYAEYYAI